MIRLLIADDEMLACEDLIRRLKKEKDFEIAGTAHDGYQTLEAIEKHKPDAVFLDIQMPGLDGLEVASRLTLTQRPPVVVFLTGCHQYAMEAFEANAIAYLLKPINDEKLSEVLVTVKAKFRDSAANKASLVSLEKSLTQRGLLRKLGAPKLPFDLNDIYFFKLSGSTIFAQKKADEIKLEITLKTLMELAGDQFVQVHENYIVNSYKVKDCKISFGGYCQISFVGSSLTVPVSRRFADYVKARFLKKSNS